MKRELSEVHADDHAKIAELRQIVAGVQTRHRVLSVQSELWNRETRREISHRLHTGKKTRAWDGHLHKAWKRVLANRRREERAAAKKLSDIAPKLTDVNRKIALVLLNHPMFSNLNICRLLDVRNEKKRSDIPLPARLQRRGVTFWVEPFTQEKFNDLRPCVHVLFSKIAKQARITRKSKLHGSPSNP